jgi:hypothetical protein
VPRRLGLALDLLHRCRRPRPWLCLVGVPLGLTAAGLNGDVWLAPPLALVAWWYAPTAQAWWVAIGLAVIGVEWGITGAVGLAAFPDRIWLVGLLWAGFALLLSELGRRARRHDRRNHW